MSLPYPRTHLRYFAASTLGRAFAKSVNNWSASLHRFLFTSPQTLATAVKGSWSDPFPPSMCLAVFSMFWMSVKPSWRSFHDLLVNKVSIFVVMRPLWMEKRKGDFYGQALLRIIAVANINWVVKGLLMVVQTCAHSETTENKSVSIVRIFLWSKKNCDDNWRSICSTVILVNH